MTVGTPTVHAAQALFVHLKPGYSIDDMWNVRQALWYDLPGGHPFTIGPRKSRDDMMIDMEIVAIFKAVCYLRGVEFAFKERNQATKAIAVCIQRGYVTNPVVWVDGVKIAQWNWDTNEVEFCDQSMMEICDMTRQEIQRATKILVFKRVERMKASRVGQH